LLAQKINTIIHERGPLGDHPRAMWVAQGRNSISMEREASGLLLVLLRNGHLHKDLGL
jgi:hypothetical protein